MNVSLIRGTIVACHMTVYFFKIKNKKQIKILKLTHVTIIKWGMAVNFLKKIQKNSKKKT